MGRERVVDPVERREMRAGVEMVAWSRLWWRESNQ